MPAFPSNETSSAMTLAMGKASHKSRVRKLKSKIGFTVRTNAKSVSKKVIAYGISKVPFVGSELKTVFEMGSQKLEQKFKAAKAASLASMDKDDPNYHHAIKAAIKSLTINNALQTIDQGRKKVAMSEAEMHSQMANGISTCTDACELFYHLFRWQVRVDKCRARLLSVLEPLQDLDTYLENHTKSIGQIHDLLVESVNEFYSSHAVCPPPSTFSASPFRHICLGSGADASRGHIAKRRLEGTALLEADRVDAPGEDYEDLNEAPVKSWLSQDDC